MATIGKAPASMPRVLSGHIAAARLLAITFDTAYLVVQHDIDGVLYYDALGVIPKGTDTEEDESLTFVAEVTEDTTTWFEGHGFEDEGD